ncbi:MAG: hypothetical protein PHN47_05160 [Clostridia bacterium]|jgi:stage III sporulation protein AG|nr:hypothetical protein [Clostridia bacterium]
MLKFFENKDNKIIEEEEVKSNFFPLTPKQKKRLLPLVVCLFVGIFLMALGSFWGGDASPPMLEAEEPLNENNVTVANKENSLCHDLEEILAKMAGVGEVSVYISYAEGERLEYAVDATTTTRKVEEKDNDGSIRTTSEISESGQMVMGENQPVLIQESKAEIQGVMVVAAGAENLQVKADLILAVQKLLGVPAHRIQVSPAG